MKKLYFSSYLIISISVLFSQELPEKREKNLLLSTGTLFNTYRDFATSPLYYDGLGLLFDIRRERIKNEVELSWGINTNFAYNVANTPSSKFFQVTNTGSLNSFDFFTSYLYEIPGFDFTEDLKFKIGSTSIYTQNLRVNSNLSNSAAGLEAFVNLMLSAKVVKDFSRKEEKTKKILIFTIRKLPIKRNISFQCDLGLLNYNYRPSYSYVYSNEIDGSNTSMLKWVFSSYQWKMNGWRLRTKIDFTRIIPKTGNGYRLSYEWDALHAPGRFEPFQMASHRVVYSIVINKIKK